LVYFIEGAMVRWILGLLVAFLVIDHLWVHFGGPFVEKLREEYKKEIAKEGQEVKLAELHKKSIIDQLIERVKGLLGKKEESKEEGR